MKPYTFLFPPSLRERYEKLITYPGTLKELVIKALEIALPVFESSLTSHAPFLKDADDLVAALRGGHMTHLEGLAAVERLAHRAALDALDNWTKEQP